MSSNFPLLTPEVANHLAVCSMSFSVKKQEALRSLPGNPYKAEIRTFGNATALLAQKTHNSELFNRVGNMSAADLPYLDAIIEWYHTHGASCSFDIVPSSASPELLWSLASKGFYQSGFYNVLYGLPQTDLAHDSDITVRAVSLEEKDVFAEVYLDSFEVPKTEVYAYVYDSIRVLVGKPTIHCLFALINNTVAAIAILHIYQQTGYLALSATLPAFYESTDEDTVLIGELAFHAATV